MISHAGRRSALVAMVGAVAVAAGCASPDLGSTSAASAGLGCVDDSKQCLDQRAAALNALMSDKKRTWVRQPASPAAYASGVRMFAFKQKKRELSCEELALGRREAEAAAPTLRGPGGQGLTPAQVSRGVMFGQEVAKELANEQGRRCRA
jgi:hypothetical protein